MQVKPEIGHGIFYITNEISLIFSFFFIFPINEELRVYFLLNALTINNFSMR